MPAPTTAEITVLTADGAASARGERLADRLTVTAGDLGPLTGWELKPEGLCRGDVCVPVRDRAALGPDGRVDLGALGALTGTPTVVDPDAGIVAFGTAAAARGAELASLEAPPFRAQDVEGREWSLEDFRGTKKLVVGFASWCGCRYDLPAWQAIQDELAPNGFTVIGVAVDEDPEAVRPWVEAVDFPVVVDRDHVITERYDIRNVPTVVWIDEDDRIVRPNDVAFGSDEFREFHKVDSGPHNEALRRWVTTGETDLDADGVREHQEPLTDDEQLARVHWRVGTELHRRGEAEAAARHWDRAAELAPHDWTIRRGTLPLRGIDPFLSDEFFELAVTWDEAGRPSYGFGPRDD